MAGPTSDAASDAEIADLIGAFPPAQAQALSALRSALLRLLPGAVETVAWGMPTVKIGPDQVLSYSGFTEHNSLFPGPVVAAALAAEFPHVITTKGTVHIDRDRPAPITLVRRAVALRLNGINASYPRSNGRTRRYYSNGMTEYTGSIRDGQMHGYWEWFRRDGTLKRSGKFKAGDPIGDWTTYDTTGQPHKITRKG
jgi:uncharacterized protein YdhG (YjbR/CyaY superfamily)